LVESLTLREHEILHLLVLDGRYVVTAGEDGMVRVFIVAVEDLMELARSRLSRGFTQEECRTYLHLPSCVED
jgi:hypothetical protein